MHHHTGGNVAVVVGHLEVEHILTRGGELFDYWVSCCKRYMIRA